MTVDVHPLVEPSVANEDALLAGPTLHVGHEVPGHGSTRSEALAAGLAAPWRVHAEIADPARLRSPWAQEAFSVHLLTDGAHWSVVVLSNNLWHNSTARAGSRTDLLHEALTFAPVESSVSGLIQRYADPMGDAPVPRGLTYCRSAVCADVVGLLLGVDYPEAEEDTFLLALGGHLQRVEERRDHLVLRRAQHDAIKPVEEMVKELAVRGIYRDAWKTQQMLRRVTFCLTTHWDPTTATLNSDYQSEVDDVVWKFFGNALDETVRPPKP